MADINTLHMPASPQALCSPHGSAALGSVRPLERRRWSNPEPGSGLLGQLRLRAVVADEASAPAPSQSHLSVNHASPSPKTPNSSVARVMHYLRIIQRLTNTLEVEVAAAGARHESTTNLDSSLVSHSSDGPRASLLRFKHTAGVVTAVAAVLWLPIAVCAELEPWAAFLGLGLILLVQLSDMSLSLRPFGCFGKQLRILDVISLLILASEFPVYCLGPFWLLPLVLQCAGVVQCARYADSAMRHLSPVLHRCGWDVTRRSGLATGCCLPAVLCLAVAWTLGIEAIRLSLLSTDLTCPARLLFTTLAASPHNETETSAVLLAAVGDGCPFLASVSVAGEVLWSSNHTPDQCFSVEGVAICISVLGSSVLECVLQAAALVGLFTLVLGAEICKMLMTSHREQTPACLEDTGDVLLRRGEETPPTRWPDEWLHAMGNTVSDLQGQVCAVLKAAHSSLAEQKPFQDVARMRTDFLMAMSHELRTPVAGVIGHAEVLQMSSLSESQRHSARVIQLCGEALLQRVGDILHYCQLCDTAVVLDIAPFVVRQLLEDVISVAERSLVEKGLRATIHLDSDVPVRLMGDAAKLQQTLMNLLNNAIRFTLPKGDVCICVRRTVQRCVSAEALQLPANLSRGSSCLMLAHGDKVPGVRSILRRSSRRVAPSKSPNNFLLPESGPPVRRVSLASSTTGDDLECGEEVGLVFEVVDTGVGIPAAQQEVVFEPFSQVDQSPTRRFDGCGLGLSICKSLVHAMQGHIGIQSPAALPTRAESSVGTKVWFTVPLHCVRGEEAFTEQTDTDPQHFRDLVAVLVLLDDQLTLQLGDMLAAMHVKWEATPLENLLAVVQASTGRVMLIVDEDVPGLEASVCAVALRSSDLALVLTNGHRVEPNTTAKPPSRAKLQQWIEGVRSQQWLEGVRPLPAVEELGQVPMACSTPKAAEAAAAAAALFVPTTPLPFQPCIAHSAPSVVVAEDSYVLQQLMRAHIERLGHQVVLCSTGKEVLDCLEKTWYPLVFMDYHMPEMDGLQCTRVIRQWEREGRLPPHPPIYIVGVTADVLVGTKQACLDAGMNCYMSKPVQSHRLAAVLRCLAAPSPVTSSPAVAMKPSVPPSPLLLPPRRGEGARALPVPTPFLLSESSSEFDPVVPESSPRTRNARRNADGGPPLLEALRALGGCNFSHSQDV
eukprot:GGOE01024969.1.p1 GENE.GGOE01024969.1~~GGOE01024969.1.p1  ORF type:complete len:1175 (-),score=301.37 GGOE01024969.1:737-4261(-)